MLTVFVQFIGMDMVLVFWYIVEIGTQQNGQLFSTQRSKNQFKVSGTIFLWFLLHSTLMPYANIQTNTFFILWAGPPWIANKYISLSHFNGRMGHKKMYIFIIYVITMQWITFALNVVECVQRRSEAFLSSSRVCVSLLSSTSVFVPFTRTMRKRLTVDIFIAWHIFEYDEKATERTVQRENGWMGSGMEMENMEIHWAGPTRWLI